MGRGVVGEGLYMEGRRGDECFIGGGVVGEGVMTVAWEGVESEKVCRSEKYCMYERECNGGGCFMRGV